MRRAWQKRNPRGCKWFGFCGGTKCKPSARQEFRSPVQWPSSAVGSRAPRTISRCPHDVMEPWMDEAVRCHQRRGTFGGALPISGGLYDQPARLLEALEILAAEQVLIDARVTEDAQKAAAAKAKSRGASRRLRRRGHG